MALEKVESANPATSGDGKSWLAQSWSLLQAKLSSAERTPPAPSPTPVSFDRAHPSAGAVTYPPESSSRGARSGISF